MKKIDEKHHIEYDVNNGIRIIKTTNGIPIPDDEPTILFRGRHRLAIPMLEYYYELCKKDGATDYQLNTLGITIDKFKNFKMVKPEVMKQPGITRGK